MRISLPRPRARWKTRSSATAAANKFLLSRHRLRSLLRHNNGLHRVHNSRRRIIAATTSSDRKAKARR